ncbi:MAG: fimbrillin family protein [Bacteroidales bacterium]|nr:fimbrillin family protein [Bacteroidales bacterium]
MRRVLNRLWLCVAALPLFSGCMNYDDCGNTSLDYESLDVSFKATLPLQYNLNEEMSFGAYGTCTRDGQTDVNMSAAPVSKMAHTMAAPYYFFSKTDEDAIVGLKGDHNYRFYAYYPYDPSCTDIAAIPVNIPSVITYDENAPALSPLIVASATVTSIIAPVPMTFSAPASCQMTIRIPDTACKVIKSIKMYPGNTSWKGRFAFSGTYDAFTKEITEDEATVSKSITVDFGPSGHEMKPGYLTVSFLMGEAKYVTGGVKLAVTDIDGVTTVKEMYNARQTFEAGSSYTYTMK